MSLPSRRWLSGALCLAVSVLGASGPSPPCAQDPARGCSYATEPRAPVREPPPTNYLPYLAGPFTRVFVPASNRYLNDHTLLRARDGTWHLFGITLDGPGVPHKERSFLHATAPYLTGPWREHADALFADASWGEGCCVWAPHALATPSAPGMMIYATGEGALRRATSADLFHWDRVASDRDEALQPPGGRDPFLLEEGGRWLLYTVGVDSESHGQIMVSSAVGDPASVTSWTRPATPVTTDPVPNYGWGNLESPFVLRYRGAWYLFLTRTGPGPTDYVRTVVLRSRDPLRFEWQPLTQLPAHAAEVVQEGGRYYLTSAGWTAAIGERSRGLSIAPLRWAPEDSARADL